MSFFLPLLIYLDSLLESTIRTRLLFKNDILKRLVKRVVLFNSLSSPHDIKIHYAAIHTDLLALQSSLIKHQLVHSMNGGEMDTFVEETASIDAEMKDTMDQVERLKDTLAKEQQRLAERKMWDAVAAECLKLNDRPTSLSRIQTLEREIAFIRHKQSQLAASTLIRRDLFAKLVLPAFTEIQAGMVAERERLRLMEEEELDNHHQNGGGVETTFGKKNNRQQDDDDRDQQQHQQQQEEGEEEEGALP